MANNRTCLVCGTDYEYCSSCRNGLNQPVWRNIFDTENCKMIFATVSDYAQKVITKEAAKKALDKCDLSQTDSYKKSIKALINEITAEKKVVNNSTYNAKQFKNNSFNTVIKNETDD